jgi:hypothetical protein
MKFTKLILFIICSCITTVLLAQPPVSGYDPFAKQILDGVTKKMDADSTKTSTFTIITRQKNGNSDSVAGEILLNHTKFKIVIKKGSSVVEEYYFDGKTLTSCIKKDGAVATDSIWGSTQRPDIVYAYDIFTIFKKGFKYKFINQDTSNGKLIQHIDLYPEHPEKKNFHTIHVAIDKEKQQIIELIYVVNDGSCDIFRVDSFIPNLPMEESIFQYKPH